MYVARRRPRGENNWAHSLAVPFSTPASSSPSGGTGGVGGSDVACLTFEKFPASSACSSPRMDESDFVLRSIVLADPSTGAAIDYRSG